MRNILIIGGTGTISYQVVEQLSKQEDNQVYVLNRGNRSLSLPSNIRELIGDINEEEKISKLLESISFDVVCDFIVFNKAQLERDIRLFKGKIKQYIFISTVCVLDRYHHLHLDEQTPIGNQWSNYGREKAKCEELLWKQFHSDGFPITIVRPTQTYDGNRIPLSVKGKTCYSVIKRILEDKEVIVHGDGTSLWASTHAEDFAKMFISLVGNKEAIGEIYQITTEEVMSWNQLYELLGELLHKKVHIVHIPSDILSTSKKYDYASNLLGDKTQSCIFHSDKIHAISNTKSKITLKEGLLRYLSYMAKHPEEAIGDDAFDQWCDDVITQYKTWKESIDIQ